MPTAPEGRKTPDSIRVIIVQLSGVSEILQSLMALRAAKQLYPNMEITFVCRDKFYDIPKRVPWIAEVRGIPSDQIADAVSTGRKKEIELLPVVAQIVAPLSKTRWDLVVNWSFTESSSYLNALIPGKVKLGYTRRPDHSMKSTDGWSSYVQAVVFGEVRQNIHLTDILTTQILTALQIHYGEPTGTGNEPVTSKGFFGTLDGDHRLILDQKYAARKWVGVQLGSSSDEVLIDVVGYIVKRHPDYNVVLMGLIDSPGITRSIRNRFDEEGIDISRVLFLVGKTEFAQWASIVSRCNWIISGESPVVHLASVHGTRVLNIASNSGKWMEFGPYGNGHYSLFGGGNEATAETVYAVWSYASSEWSHQRQKTMNEHFSQLGWSSSLLGVDIFRSRIRPPHEGGGVVYESVTTETLSVSDWFSLVIGQIARSWYCGWVAPIGQEISREQITFDLLRELRELRSSCDDLVRLCRQAEKTASFIVNKTKEMKSDKLMTVKDRQILLDLGNRLAHTDRMIEELGRVKEPFRAFSQISRVMMHNLRGGKIKELGKESADSYRRLAEGVDLLKQWLDHTVQLARPQMVDSSKVIPIGNRRPEPQKEM